MDSFLFFFILDRIIQDYFLIFLTSRMEVRKLNPPPAEIYLSLAQYYTTLEYRYRDARISYNRLNQ
jgi:hypothetical protein